MLHQQLKDELKEALRSKDAEKLTVLRGLLSAFTNENVAKKRKPDEMLSDDEALSVMTRASKQRKDSIQQFRAGGREDLVAKEQAELKIIESYLPTQMNEDEIRAFAEHKKIEWNMTETTQKNQFMGMLMKELKGKADGTVVKAVVDSLF